MNPLIKPSLEEFQSLLGLPFPVLRLLVTEYDDVPKNPVLAGMELVGDDTDDVTARMTKAETIAAHEYVKQH